MSKQKITLTERDREELTPLLNVSKAERELMPKEIQEKLEILANEGTEKFDDIEQIIEESLHVVETLGTQGTCKMPKRRYIKDYLWWQTNYRIFLAKRKAQRAYRKARKHKKKH